MAKVPFPLYVRLYNTAGRPIWARDAARARNLEFSYQLPGGDIGCSFELSEKGAGLAKWEQSVPQAAECVVQDFAGRLIWRGRFASTSRNNLKGSITVLWQGYWTQTKKVPFTADFVSATPVTLYHVARWCLGLDGGTNVLPLIPADGRFILNPGLVVNSGGQDLKMVQQYPQDIFRSLLNLGDGANIWYMAIWSDLYLRLFPRDLTLKWFVWEHQLTGPSTSSVSRLSQVTHVRVLWKTFPPAEPAETWDQIPAGDGLTNALDAPKVAEAASLSAIALNSLGTRSVQIIDNPFGTQLIGNQLALQALRDRYLPVEEAQPISIGPTVMDVRGNRRPSYLIRPGDVIRVVNRAAFGNPTQMISNLGQYYVIQVQVNAASGITQVMPVNANPHLTATAIASAI